MLKRRVSMSNIKSIYHAVELGNGDKGAVSFRVALPISYLGTTIDQL